MTDQLSLRLDPPLPRLPSGLRPMLARPLPARSTRSAHLFEPIWGGARALALIGPAAEPGMGDVVLVAEDGTEGPAPLDLAGLAARVQARSAVLDGEIVVVDDAGRLDHEELARRFAGEPGRPLSYLAFDLLDLDGRSLLNLPLEKRRALLRQVLRPGDEVGRGARDRRRGPGAVRGRLRPGAVRDQGAAANQPVPARRPEPPLAQRGRCRGRREGQRQRRPGERGGDGHRDRRRAIARGASSR